MDFPIGWVKENLDAVVQEELGHAREREAAVLLEAAWGIIANAGWDAGSGDVSGPKPPGWHEAAVRWRDEYFLFVQENPGSATEEEEMPTEEHSETRRATKEAYGPYRAVIDKWTDADSCRIRLDLGFNITMLLTCQCFGIKSSFKAGTPDGNEALEYANQVCPPEDQVRVFSHGRNKYEGRFLGDIITADGRNYGELMITAGYAEPFF